MNPNILDIVTTFLNQKGVTVANNMDLFEIGAIDSMSIIEMISYLEEKTGVSFDATDIKSDNFRTLDSIVEFIKKKARA